MHDMVWKNLVKLYNLYILVIGKNLRLKFLEMKYSIF